ncbi:hypothetical protein [Hymenobacter oligotrophus]|uniref:hypothetical protein n=1 Tax=Hymenobacter oligotrophus TaxID=2319843 RepID=UPI0013C2AC28|nr:hypothetical protein [Hymenobacter oligotrophus]
MDFKANSRSISSSAIASAGIGWAVGNLGFIGLWLLVVEDSEFIAIGDSEAFASFSGTVSTVVIVGLGALVVVTISAGALRAATAEGTLSLAADGLENDFFPTHGSLGQPVFFFLSFLGERK